MIVKIQRPLGGTDMSNLLITNKERTIDYLVPLASEVGQYLFRQMGGRLGQPKIYRSAYFNEKGILMIETDPIEDQTW